MNALQSAEAVDPVSAAGNLRAPHRGHRRRDMPVDFAATAPSLGVKQLCQHYSTASRVIRRWLREAGVMSAGGLTGVDNRIRPIPADFADMAPRFNITQLSEHYRCSPASIRKWVQETGTRAASPTRRPVPDSFARVAHSMTIDGLCKHFGACDSTVKRWLTETGKTAAPHLIRHRTYSTIQPVGDVTLAGRAADHLRRQMQVYRATVLPIHKRRHLPNEGKEHWMVAGKGALDAAALIDLAQSKGFDPKAWARI